MFSKLAKTSYLFAAVLALSLWSFAAQYQAKPQKEAKGKSVTVTGCLQKGDQEGEFILTGSDGRQFRLSSSPSVNLAEHVGHTVTVTGTKTHKEQARKESGKAKAGKSGLANLQVTDFQMVSETCTAGPK